MDARHILPGLLVMAASAGLVLTACNKEEKTESKNRSVPQDLAGAVSERDTAFENSFYGPPGSDWRFTPGTSIYDFENKGIGGTAPDSPAEDSMHLMKDSLRRMEDGKR
jgi:hypothetical protein